MRFASPEANGETGNTSAIANENARRARSNKNTESAVTNQKAGSAETEKTTSTVNEKTNVPVTKKPRRPKRPDQSGGKINASYELSRM